MQVLLTIVHHHLPINKKNRNQPPQQHMMMKMFPLDENYLPHCMINEVIVDIVPDQKKVKQIEKQWTHPILMKVQFIKIKQIMKKIQQQVYIIIFLSSLHLFF
jgi:hypothetical protein